MDVLFLKLSLPYGISSCKFNENDFLRENTKNAFSALENNKGASSSRWHNLPHSRDQ